MTTKREQLQPKPEVRPLAGSLARGLRLLSVLAEPGKQLGLTELARTAGLDKATTYRLAQVLVAHSYLEQDPDRRRYQLGVSVLDLASAYLAGIDVRTRAMPHLRALSREFGESIGLATLDGANVVYLEVISVARPRSHVQVGSRLPAYCSAMGRAMLAWLPEDELCRLLGAAPLQPWTPKSITDLTALARILETVRQSGYAVSDEEVVLGLRSVAAPIHDRHGTPVAAMNLAVQSVEWSLAELVTGFAPRIVEAAAAISAELGFSPVTTLATAG